MRPFILITGMHRSGTSFLSRSLNLAGVHLGNLKSLTSNEWQFNDDNLKGHWENKKFLELGNKTLSNNNGSWHEVPEHIQIDENLGNEITTHCTNLINHPSLTAGFKDPRIILNLDSWLPYLPKDIVIIGIFRHPLKVAQSLKKRDNFSYEKSLALWKIYNEKLLSILEKHSGFLIDFDWPKAKLLLELNLILNKIGLITNPAFSEWYSKELLHSDKTYDTSYKLPDDLSNLYTKLKNTSKKNTIVTVPRISYSKDELQNIFHGLFDDLTNQGKYFKKINDENLQKISTLQNSAKNPLKYLLKIYNSRPDLMKTFPEAAEGNLKTILNWAAVVEDHLIGSSEEKEIILHNREWYKNNLEKIYYQETTSKLTTEKQQQDSQISKLTTEKQQQDEFVTRLEKEKKELTSNVSVAHKVVEQKENENYLLQEEISTIKQSISWGLFLKVQKFLTFVFPPNTRRGTSLSLILLFLKYSRTYGITTATKMALSFMKNGRYVVPTPSIPIKSWKDSTVFNDVEINSMKKEITEFKIKPKISIIMPVFNVDKKWLVLAIDSVRNQIYENWELCIVDDASTTRHIKPILIDYEKKDTRIKVKFLEENKNISGASNEALSLVTGEYTGLLDHDDEISINALYDVVKSINQNPSVQIIYSDENHISITGERIDPFFKPDYSPDLLMTCHYMVHFMIYSTSLLKRLNGFRAGFDGAQDYDLVLRAVEKTDEIHHIPKLLYGWRNIPTSTASGSGAKPYAQIAAQKALEEALKRRKINGTPEYLQKLGYFKINYNIVGKPLVSIIITTRDRPDLLSRLLSSIEKKSTYDNYEIIIVDHLGEKKETKEFLKSLKHKVIRYEKEFNISNLFNFAEEHANGEYLLTMNDDLEVISENWIEAMLGPCQRDEVAIVGAQLIYPDTSAQGQIKSQTIQHAGVTLGVGGVAGHAFRHIPYIHNGYFALNKTIRNYSAVTGACMLVKRNVYKKVNGYDPVLKVAYNDIDFCLRVRKEGYLVVYTPYAKLYHYEGASRGIMQPTDNTQTFVNRWKNELLKRDPYYNVNLSLLREDFTFSYFGIPVEETPLALLLEIYATRPDLQRSFPEVSKGRYENLIQWAATFGISSQKYRLPNDPTSHILFLYKFWYKENSEIKDTDIKQ